jgi:DNA-binding MarR family transcriptional regulator
MLHAVPLLLSTGVPVTTSPAPAGASGPVGRLEDLRSLSDLLPRFMRLAAAHKAQVTGEGRDRAALVLLYPIKRLGPVRQGALADVMHADPSTVSRHVAALVDRGLVRRVADESDGRASRLVITDAGHTALHDLCAEREARLDAVTADWDADDLATFTRLFARLIDDLEKSLPGATTDPVTPVPPAPRGTR